MTALILFEAPLLPGPDTLASSNVVPFPFDDIVINSFSDLLILPSMYFAIAWLLSIEMSSSLRLLILIFESLCLEFCVRYD